MIRTSLCALVLFLALNFAVARADVPAIPGSYWSLMALEEKGKPIKEAQNPADVEFLKDGKWGILHYGGRREEGKYSFKDSRLEMKTIDGEDYISGGVTWTEGTGTLEIDSGEWIMRLRLRNVPK